MDNIPVRLRTELDNIGAQFKKVIFCNELKGRCTLQIFWGNSECVMKWNEYTRTEHLKKLQKEISFYAEAGHENIPYIPKVFHTADNFLILEKLNGDSVRNSIIHEIETGGMGIRKILDGILRSVEWMYLQNGLFVSRNEDIDERKELRHYVYKMMNSGPMHTNNDLVTEKLLAVLSVRAVRIITKGENSSLRCGDMVHGDLHLNNFYAADDGRVCILDWENTRIGSRYLELAYLYAQVSFLLKSRGDIARYWRDITMDAVPGLNLSPDVFGRYAELFCSIIECNPRYGYKAGRYKIMKEQLKMAVKIMTRGLGKGFI